MGNGGFRKLQVWERAKDLAVYMYKTTNSGSFNKDFGLKDQIRRASVSIASNIAEGDERNTNRESIRFFYIAKGSLAELLTQSIISNEIGHLRNDQYDHIKGECETIGKMLGKLIKVRDDRQ